VKPFLFNAGRLFALIFMSTGIMLGIRCLFLERNQPFSMNLASSAIYGLIVGSYVYYRAKCKS